MSARERVERTDALPLLDPPEKMPNGFLRLHGRVARVGIQEYRTTDGKTARELRLPEDVFHAKSLASFEQAPVTVGHPPGFLNLDEAAKHSVGSVGGARRDGDHVTARLMITDRKAAKAIAAGTRELSAGYGVELHPTTPELLAQWGPHDFVQRNITIDHVAIVPRGRCGPSCSVRADCACDGECATSTSTSTTTTTTPSELEDDDIMGDTATTTTSNSDDRATLVAERDRLQGELDTLRAQRSDAQREEEAVREEVRARVDLVRKLERVGIRLDETGDVRAIRRAALRALRPKLDLANRSDAWVEGALVGAMPERRSAIDDARAAVSQTGGIVVVREDGAPGWYSDPDDARDAMLRRNDEQFDEPTAKPYPHQPKGAPSMDPEAARRYHAARSAAAFEDPMREERARRKKPEGAK